MSKAFTKESDSDDDADAIEAPDALPAGAKNYITPQGLDRLQGELRHLRTVERPKVVEVVSWAAGNGDRSENGDYIYGKKRLREIDRRMKFLRKHLEIAQVVDPQQQQGLDRVFFGATVTYRDASDTTHTIRIVGVDEIADTPAAVSWISPIARALHKACAGDRVELRTPHGVEVIEVLKISYPYP
ncbi:MAG: transcription elongation factor GreB [Alphaproteobacteria bacterium]